MRLGDPGARSPARRSGVAWPPVCSPARGEGDGQERTRADEIPDALRQEHNTSVNPPPPLDIEYVKAIWVFITLVNNNALSIATGPGGHAGLIFNKDEWPRLKVKGPSFWCFRAPMFFNSSPHPSRSDALRRGRRRTDMLPSDFFLPAPPESPKSWSLSPHRQNSAPFLFVRRSDLTGRFVANRWREDLHARWLVEKNKSTWCCYFLFFLFYFLFMFFFSISMNFFVNDKKENLNK